MGAGQNPAPKLMTDNRRKVTYQQWTAVEAGIIEDVRRHTWAKKSIDEITARPDMEEAERGARLVWPILACVTPLVTFDEFVILKALDADELIHLALDVNPEWDNAGILSEKKSGQKLTDGTPNSKPTPKTAPRPRHSRQK